MKTSVLTSPFKPKLLFIALVLLFISKVALAVKSYPENTLNTPVYPDLVNWLTTNQSMVIRESKFFQTNATPDDEHTLFRKIILDPTLATKIWDELMNKMQKMQAPALVMEQAKQYRNTLATLTLSTTDRQTLASIVDKSKGLTDIGQVSDIVNQEMTKGTLSKNIGTKMIQNLRAGEPIGYNQFRPGIHFASMPTSHYSPIPVGCIVLFCVPAFGLVAFAFKACRG